MQELIYNPQKGRLETISIEYSDENTTWFDNCSEPNDIYMLTDFEGGLLIKENNHTYPVWIYEATRAEIDNNVTKARELRKLYMEE